MPKQWLNSLFVKRMLAGHSAFGLVAAALLYSICLTGLVCVFAQELQRWERPDVPELTSVDKERMADVLAQTVALGNGIGEVRMAMVFGPEPGLPQLRGRVVGDDFERIWAFTPEGGPVFELDTPATRFVRDLHGSLHAGSWGSYLVGLSGIMLLSLVLSGVLSHPRIFRDAFRFRRGGSLRLQEADLHNRLSVWGLPFHIVIGFSGAFLGLASVLGGLIAFVIFAGDMDKAAEALTGEAKTPQTAGAATYRDVPAMMHAVERAAGDSEIRFMLISNPGRAQQRLFIDVVSDRQLASGESYAFDAAGTALGPAGFFDGSIPTQLRAAMVPLHYGNFGGLPVKWLYALLATGLCVIISSGVTVWSARIRDGGRAARRWERTWAAFVWGQVTAISAAWGVATFTPTLALPVFASVSVCLQATAFLNIDLRIFIRLQRGLAGVSLLGLPILHLFHWGFPAATHTALVSGCLAILGLLIAIAGYRGFWLSNRSA